jgi:hypothetical protein
MLMQKNSNRSFMEAFLYGVLGGFLAELFGLWKLRHELKPNLPPYLRSPFYWLMTILMILSGGGIALMYVKSGVVRPPILAVNVGASAPLIIGGLTQAPPKINAQ